MKQSYAFFVSHYTPLQIALQRMELFNKYVDRFRDLLKV